MRALAADPDARDDGLLGSYDAVVDSLIARRVALVWPQEELDFRTGFSSGFTSHLETFRTPTGRRATDRTLERWMAALGVKLRLVVTEEIRPAARRPTHTSYRRPEIKRSIGWADVRE